MSQGSKSSGTTQSSRKAERRRAAQLAVEAAHVDSGASVTDARGLVAIVVRRRNELEEEAKVIKTSLEQCRRKITRGKAAEIKQLGEMADCEATLAANEAATKDREAWLKGRAAALKDREAALKDRVAEHKDRVAELAALDASKSSGTSSRSHSTRAASNYRPTTPSADELFNVAELADYAMWLGARTIHVQGNHLAGGVGFCHDTITLQFSAPDAAAGGSAAAPTVPTQVANYVASQTPFYPMKVHCVADTLPTHTTPTGSSPTRPAGWATL